MTCYSPKQELVNIKDCTQNFMECFLTCWGEKEDVEDHVKTVFQSCFICGINRLITWMQLNLDVEKK